MQLRWHPPRAFREAGGAELHRGPRAILVLVRGSCRAGTGAPPPVCACSSRPDGFHAYGERRRAPAATPTSTLALALAFTRSPSSLTTTTTSASTTTTTTTTAGAVTRVVAGTAVGDGGCNVCRCRYVLSCFIRQERESEAKRPTPIPRPRILTLPTSQWWRCVFGGASVACKGGQSCIKRPSSGS